MKKILTKAFFHPEKCELIHNACIEADENFYKVKEKTPRQIQIDRLEDDNTVEVVDLSRFYVIPALIDAHVHLYLDGKGQANPATDYKYKPISEELLLGRLSNIYSFGIGAVRDGGDVKGIGLKGKELSNNSGSPLVIACGEGIRKKDYYGSFLGKGLEGSKASTQKKVETLVKNDIDQLKLIINGVVSFKEYGKVGKLQFSFRELEEIVNLAKSFNLPVMAHVNSEEYIKLAISAGVHSIEHGYFISKKLLLEMAKTDIYWVPTVTPIYNQQNKGFLRQNLNRQQKKIIRQLYTEQLSMIGEAINLGVKVGIGTDAGAMGVEHGSDFFQELELFQMAGLDNKSILQSACKINREVLGISQDKNLGFLALADNPLNNLGAVKKPVRIIR